MSKLDKLNSTLNQLEELSFIDPDVPDEYASCVFDNTLGLTDFPYSVCPKEIALGVEMDLNNCNSCPACSPKRFNLLDSELRSLL